MTWAALELSGFSPGVSQRELRELENVSGATKPTMLRLLPELSFISLSVVVEPSEISC
jgi:hypothetical protein